MMMEMLQFAFNFKTKRTANPMQPDDDALFMRLSRVYVGGWWWCMASLHLRQFDKQCSSPTTPTRSMSWCLAFKRSYTPTLHAPYSFTGRLCSVRTP